MATIEVHNATIGIAQGATWDTGVQAVKKLQVQTLTIDDTTEVRETGNHDVGFWASKIKQGKYNVSGSIVVDCNFGGEWLLLYALMAGTAAAPAEQTPSQSDYLHSITIADTHRKFFTLAYEAEDDVVCQIASCKIGSVAFSFTENGPLLATFSFIGSSHVNTGAATTNAQLNALVLTQDEDPTIFNGANNYVRLGNYSTGTALTSTNNVGIISGTITVNRPITPYFAIRGTSTQSTYEPYSSALGSAEMQLTFANIDDSVYDPFNKYKNATYQMCEIFLDGAQLGTGLNTSLKFQLPYLMPVGLTGYGVSGQAVVQQPTLTLRSGIAPAAAAGMSGFTKAIRLQTIDKRSTAYVS